MLRAAVTIVGMNPAAMLKAARERSGLSQSQVAQRAGVHHTMVSAYERGRRTPGVATFERLLKAAGAELAVEVVAEGSGLDDRIARTLALPVEERVAHLAGSLEELARCFGEFRFAVDGLAAAAVHGVPVEVPRIQVLLADEAGLPEAMEPILRRSGIWSWAEELGRFSYSNLLPGPVLRLVNPSLWWLCLWDVELEITLCAPERLDRVQVLPFRDRTIPVVALWDLQLADPEAAEVIERTRTQVLRARG